MQAEKTSGSTVSSPLESARPSTTFSLDEVGLPYANHTARREKDARVDEEAEPEVLYRSRSGDDLLISNGDGSSSYKPYRLGKMAKDDQAMTQINQVNLAKGTFDRFQMLNKLQERHLATRDDFSKGKRPKGQATAAVAAFDRVPENPAVASPSPSSSGIPQKKVPGISSAKSRQTAYFNNLTYVVDDKVHGGMTKIVHNAHEARLNERILRMQSFERRVSNRRVYGIVAHDDFFF